VQVTDKQGKPLSEHNVTVSPHGMKMVALRELATLKDTQGGVRVVSSETTDNLVINGGLEDPAVGYSATLPFAFEPVDPSKPAPINIAELGLMAGAADPMMLFPAGTTFTPYSVLRNVSDAAVLVTPTLWWMEGGVPRSARLPRINLLPYQTESLDVMSLLSVSGLKNFNGSFNLVFDGEARRGALVLASGSVDQTNTYVFEVIARGVTESAAKSLQYWSTGNGDDTMVAVWNPADETQDFVFTLFFSGGHYIFPLHLEARATRTFNVSEIVQNQVPDAEGNIIPASVNEGTAKIAGSRAENEHILVGIDSGIYNVRKATCGVNCMECDGLTSMFVVDNPFAVAVSRTHQLISYGTYNTGGQYAIGGSWSSNLTSVATVSGGLVTGVSPGSVTISVMATDEPAGLGYICTAGNCPVHNFGGGSGGGVPVVITKIDPNWGKAGTTALPVTITGSGFGSSPAPTVSFGGTGITMTYGTRGDTTITGTLNIPASEPLGTQDVKVTNTGAGITSAPVSFEVTPASGQAVPINFILTSASDDGGGALPLLDSFYSWQSSSGNPADLSSCSMRENVTYDNTNNATCPNNTPPQKCYYPPSPPWAGGGKPGTGYPNPTSPQPGPANGGKSEDQNSVTNLNFVKPYAASSFSSTQYVQYSCGGGAWINVYGPVAITRTLSNSSGKWAATVSRADTPVTSTYILATQ
jgi:hypothetical protein